MLVPAHYKFGNSVTVLKEIWSCNCSSLSAAAAAAAAVVVVVVVVV
jgi:hypothetical protein